MIPSLQQQAVYDAILTSSRSLRVLAVAGAGKTTTLVESIRHMKGQVALAAYNKAIAVEISSRIADVPNAKAGTFHSFGNNALCRNLKKRPEVNKNKVQQWLVRQRAIESVIPFATRLVSYMKQRGLVKPTKEQVLEIVDHFGLDQIVPYSPDDLIGEGIHLALAALEHSKLDVATIDYDDMIYLPIALGFRVPQHDWVLVDEAQDTNPARRMLARAMLRPDGGRLIAVGDPHQAIYGFTGADGDALNLIKDEFDCRDYPLTVTYRCPKAVVALARQYVSHIEAHASAPAGTVRTITEKDWAKEVLTPQDVILCRLKKPLVQLAFQLLGRGIACHVEGSDIGIGLVKLLNRFGGKGTIQTFLDRLHTWGAEECAKFRAKEDDQKAEDLMDRVETLTVIAERFAPTDALSVVVSEISRLFGESATERIPTLTLSTIHRAKGREWPRVYLLGREKLMPSKWARQPWEQEQEINLIYVALTRAQSELVEVQL